jgi:hypothetical protein
LLSSIITFCVAGGAGTALGAVLADLEGLDVLDVLDAAEVLEVFEVLGLVEVFEVLPVFEVVEVLDVLAVFEVVAAFELVELFEVLDDGVDLVDFAGCGVSVAACAPVMPRHRARALRTTTVFRLSKRISTSTKANSYRGSAFCLRQRSRR